MRLPSVGILSYPAITTLPAASAAVHDSRPAAVPLPHSPSSPACHILTVTLHAAFILLPLLLLTVIALQEQLLLLLLLPFIVTHPSPPACTSVHSPSYSACNTPTAWSQAAVTLLLLLLLLISPFTHPPLPPAIS
jgi:hypothetical protein